MRYFSRDEKGYDYSDQGTHGDAAYCYLLNINYVLGIVQAVGVKNKTEQHKQQQNT
jgi:hypothetical protein